MSSNTDDPDPGRSALRSFDADRDAAVELLATAASDGRLTLDEYSERVGQALVARTRAELARVTGDLDAGPQGAASAPEELRAVLGSEARKGRWRVPSHLILRAVLGDCRLELQDALLTARHTTIDASAVLGSITIVVPEGIDVRLAGTATLGSKSSHVETAPAPNAPIVEIRANALLGSVTVRPPGLRDRLAARLTSRLTAPSPP